MSDDEDRVPRFDIDPEPTGAELVAILATLRSAPEPVSTDMPRSQWGEIARREQLRTPLDDRRTGWTR